MKILLVGASGIIGQAVKQALSNDHQIITANYTSAANVSVDLDNVESIKAMFATIGKLDAIISTAGNGTLAPLDQLTDSDFETVLNNKLMGQINLLRYGRANLKRKGSVTLTSGMAARQPFPGTSTISMATAALEAFVKAASLELEDIRLNTVSPVFVKESMERLGFDSTHGLSAAVTAKAYVAAVEGNMHGQVIDTSDFA